MHVRILSCGAARQRWVSPDRRLVSVMQARFIPRGRLPLQWRMGRGARMTPVPHGNLLPAEGALRG
jgi:hypothetical protein